VAYRVSDLAASMNFYTALGYRKVGRIDIGDGASLTVLKFPGEEFGAMELIYQPADGPVDLGTGFSYFVVQVDNLAATIEALSQEGLTPGPIKRHGGPDGPQTSSLTDPDGYRIELVEWPPGHADRPSGQLLGVESVALHQQRQAIATQVVHQRRQLAVRADPVDLTRVVVRIRPHVGVDGRLGPPLRLGTHDAIVPAQDCDANATMETTPILDRWPARRQIGVKLSSS
jgi:lactoylglutathione lyase